MPTKRRLTCLDTLPRMALVQSKERHRAARLEVIALIRKFAREEHLSAVVEEYDDVRQRTGDELSRIAASGLFGRTLFDLPEFFRQAGEDPYACMEELEYLFSDFSEQLHIDAVSKVLVEFLDRLKADLNAISRGYKLNRKGPYATLPEEERRRITWRQEIKPQLSGVGLYYTDQNTDPPTMREMFDELPSPEELAALQQRARRSRPPSPDTYWASIMHILSKTKLPHRKLVRFARDLITEQGFDLDEEWAGAWDRLIEDEYQRAGQEEEKAEEV